MNTTPLTTLGRRLLRLSLLACAPAVAFSAAGNTPGPAIDIVELPRFEVTADRILPPLEKWHYVTLPGYEILSNASANTTKRFVKDFYLLQQVARTLLPQTSSTQKLPTYVVLCDRGNAFTHFSPKGWRMDEEARGLYFSDAERTAIVVDFSPGPDDEVRPTANQAFYQSYFREILKRELGSDAPDWMEEGITRLFSTVDFNSRWIEFAKVSLPGFGFGTGAQLGSPSGRRAVGADGLGSMSVDSPSGLILPRAGAGTTGRPLIPLKDFFSLTLTGGLGKYSPMDFSNQSYLFAHMCLYGQRGTYQRGYYKLVQRALQGPITEQVFQECFGKSFGTFGAIMRGYSQSGDYKMMVKTKKNGLELTPAPEFTLRTGTDAESGRIAGEVLRLAGRRNDALNRLIAPYIRGDRTPDLLAALGLAEAWAQHPERARKFLEAAAKANTTRARAYVELGRLRFDEIKARAAAENRPITEDEYRFVIEALESGLPHPPALDELYNTLAGIWAVRNTKPTPGQYAALVKGCHENPKNLVLAHNVAAAGIQHNYLEESRPLVEHGLRHATNEKARIAFSKLNSLLPAKAPATSEVLPDNALPESPTPANTSPATNTSAATTPPPPSGV